MPLPQVTHRLLDTIDESAIAQLRMLANRGERFQGAAILQDLPLLLFNIFDASDANEFIRITPDAEQSSKSLTILPWGWNPIFGSALTITVTFSGRRGPAPAVFLSQQHLAFKALENGQFVGLFAFGNRILKCLVFDINEYVPTVKPEIASSDSFDSGVGFFRTQWTCVQDHLAMLHDEKALYWATILHRFLHSRLSKKERLSVSWVKTYEHLVRRFVMLLQKLNARSHQTHEDKPLPQEMRYLLQALHDKDSRPDCALEFLRTLTVREPRAIAGVIHLAEDVSKWADQDTADALFELILVHLHGSELTRCGRAVPCLRRDSSIAQIEINPREFPDGSVIGEYWQRMPDHCRLNWEGIIRAGDFPADLRTDSESLQSLPRAEAPIQIEASADALLDEATTQKKWTIPPGAVIELPIGPFVHIEAYEESEEVLFVLRTQTNEFVTAAVSPKDCGFVLPTPVLTLLDARIEVALKLLLAAIIRDFWVVENREAVFSRGPSRQGPRIKRGKNDTTRIVYLPRVRYVSNADIKSCSTQLGHEERRAHFVRAHLRRSEHASKQQEFLAKRYGFALPKGYTFVRPHERGKHQRDVIYRSRSALQSLYVVEEQPQSSAIPKWFRFERDVHGLMRALGFDAQHVAAARKGDKGVDVYATKGADLELVNWVISCKCVHPKRKIGPVIVRELIGALEEYPRGTRGMIVTTSRFSEGARKLAESHKIRLIDGAEFVQMLADSQGP